MKVSRQSQIRLAYRVTRSEEVMRFPADFLQVSVFWGWPNAMETMLRTVEACRSLAIPYVIHPVEYPLSELRPERRKIVMEDLSVMAAKTDLALIVHDETAKGGKRLSGESSDAYREALLQLTRLCPVSIENATNSHDVKWFWSEYAQSITLDIGHLELAGIDSVEYVSTLEPEYLARVEYVHMHRVNGVRGGIRDHWGLVEGCRELAALKSLTARKEGLGVILEVIEPEDTKKSLDLLNNL
ncbi:MAG: hypothetical protein H6Q55_44 [Deltaproteobacteria bacterium]|nr:hypothetical protein [Deltaproteobacteria bacterium]